MTKKRGLLIALAGLVVILGIIGLLLRNHATDQSPAKASPARKVVLDNYAQALPDVAGSDVIDIESALYQKLSSTVDSPAADSYRGVVRGSSVTITNYNYAESSTKLPYYQFLVDIPDAKRTFQVTLAGGKDRPVDLIHILCVGPDDLRYGPFTCEDPNQ